MEITMKEYLQAIGEMGADKHTFFSEEFVREWVRLDCDYEGYDGDIELCFNLIDTTKLALIADSIRENKGYDGIVDENGYCIGDAYYNFYLTFYCDGEVRISFNLDWGSAYDFEDRDEEYIIPLSEEEQRNVWRKMIPIIEQNLNYEIIKMDLGFKWRQIG